MKNGVLFLVASLVIALVGYGLVRPHKPPPAADPYAHLYVESEYRLGPCALPGDVPDATTLADSDAVYWTSASGSGRGCGIPR